MASTPIPEDFGRTIVQIINAGDPDPMSFQFDLATDGTITPTEMAEHAKSALITSGLAVAANFQTGWSWGIVTSYMTLGGNLLAGFATIGVAGSASGGTMPSNVALLVRKRTAFVGRKYRGRMYIPPFALASANVDRLGTVSATPLATLTTRFNALYDLLNTSPYATTLLHADGSSPTFVTEFQVQATVATQRRRLRN